MATTVSNNGEKEVRKVDFAYEGDRIVLPKDMDLDEAEKAIQRQRDEENVTVNINEPILCTPFDGAVALMRVLKRRYGWTNLVPEDMGWWGTRPPSMVGVEIGVDERIQVPWGNMQVPKIDGTLQTNYWFNEGMPCFKLTGTVKRKHERFVAEIAQQIREEVKRNSIYRAKTVKINFRDSDGERKEFDFNLAPKFIDLGAIGDSQPIFSESIANAIRINIHNPIRFSARCRKKGASLKKGIMLGGPYGTGKTLEAFECAQLCAQHGWTFLYLEDVRYLDLAYGFARLYQPCLLFAEDADKALAGPRTPEMDKVLNVIDGVESKGEQSVMLILTTNCLEVINRAFLRPGRIDAVINVLPPDVEACLKIVRKYVAEGDCKLSGSAEELKKAIEPLVGANAAFFRNTVEQCKLSAIEKMDTDDADVVISPDDLRIVAEGMVPHAKLINPEHGKKSLLDLQEEMTDPLQMGFEILSQKFAEAFVDQITNPKVLKGIIVKKMKKRGMNGDPSNN